MTEPLFVFGPLAWPPLLEEIVGAGAAQAAPVATARGHVLTCDPDNPFDLPGIVPGDGAVAGVLVSSEVDVVRLEFVAAALLATGWRTILLERKDGSTFQAKTCCGHPGPGAWHLTEWLAHGGEVMRVAVQEVIGLMGHRPAEDVALHLPIVLSRAAARIAARVGVPADLRSDTASDTVLTLACDTLHAGFFLTRGYSLRHPRFDGTMSPEMRREVFVATDAALVLPYDPLRDRVMLVEQFRMGPFGRGDPRPWMLEPVAGRIDPGETPEETARRECIEEAGLPLRALEKISTHYCTPGYSTEVFYLFLGLCDLPDMREGRGGLASEHEDIRTHVVDFDRAMALLESGEANNGPLVLSLFWLQRERARLRASA